MDVSIKITPPHSGGLEPGIIMEPYLKDGELALKVHATRFEGDLQALADTVEVFARAVREEVDGTLPE